MAESLNKWNKVCREWTSLSGNKGSSSESNVDKKGYIKGWDLIIGTNFNAIL